MSPFVAPTHYLRGAPRGKNYRRLLQIARDRCDEFSLVYRSSRLNESGVKLEEKLESFLTRSLKVMEWPGTKTFGTHPETLRFYGLNDESVTVLAEAPGLFSFLWPHLPEDLLSIETVSHGFG